MRNKDVLLLQPGEGKIIFRASMQQKMIRYLTNVRQIEVKKKVVSWSTTLQVGLHWVEIADSLMRALHV